MKRMVLGVAILLLAVEAAEAGEPAPQTLFENGRVAVIAVSFAPGDEEAKHTHQRDLVGIFLTAGFIESTSPDGKTE